MINTWAECANQIWFDGCILRRINILLEPERVMPNSCRGYFKAPQEMTCVLHCQIHCGDIHLNSQQSPEVPQNHWWRDLLGTLIHESCHAYVEIFLKRVKLTFLESLVVVGLGGHGQAWSTIFGGIGNTLLYRGVLGVSNKDHCAGPEYTEKRRRQNMTLCDNIESSESLSGREICQIISYELGFPLERTNEWLGLCIDLVEAIAWLEGYWPGYWGWKGAIPL